jgi:hypothetical protein
MGLDANGLFGVTGAADASGATIAKPHLEIARPLD